METVIFVQGHLTIDALEEYAFSRLSEGEVQILEEHLLVCAACQASLAEVDEYILLMKEATAPYLPQTESAPRSNDRPGHTGAGLAGIGYAAAAIAFAGIVFLALASQHPAQFEPAASQVPLVALRGGTPSMNHARAGRPLELAMDTTGLATTSGLATTGGLPATGGLSTTGGSGTTSGSETAIASTARYRVEVVDAQGSRVWSREISAGPGPLPARIAGGLKAGVYWVRLYSGDQLVREFGLLAD